VDAVIEAGAFGVWLDQFAASLRGNEGTDVPCGTCVGCCVSGYPVPIRRADLLDDVLPSEFVVPVSTLSKMLVPRSDGTCPMLSENQCSIYARRPQTCRDYDCRVFAAAGIDAGGAQRSVINQRVRAWSFSYGSEAERRTHEAIKAAARFIQEHPSAFAGRAPSAPSGIAVLAVKAFEVFLDSEIVAGSPQQIASAIVAASRKFDFVV
jgi:Fe-S-cluster containining protein